MAETVTSYTIRDSGPPGHPALRYHVQADGTIVATNVALSPQASWSLLDLPGQFNAFFEHHRGRGITTQALQALGSQLVALGDGLTRDIRME
jgi:hypothetical protein